MLINLFIKYKILDFVIFIQFIIYSSFSYSQEIYTIKGISLNKREFYDPAKKDFTCLDGSLTIPFNYVNDDYCDCNDGTDEPGTSACPNGVFYCINNGHQPLNIPSSRINDGICDCCDGSDEFNTTTVCDNFCGELQRQDREAAQDLIKGYEIKESLIKEGKKLKKERQKKFKKLEKKSKKLIGIKTEKETAKTSKEKIEKTAIDKFIKEEEARKLLIEQEKEQLQAEENERLSMAAFMDLDVDQNVKITMDEIQERSLFDTNKDGIVSDEEAKYFLTNKEEVELDEFKRDCWPLIKPQYSSSQTFTIPGDGQQYKKPARMHPDPKINEEFYREQMRSSEDVEDDFVEDVVVDEYQPTVSPLLLKELGLDSLDFTTPEPEPVTYMYDEEVQVLIDEAEVAREEFTEAERKASDIESEFELGRKMRKIMSIDFGSSEEYGSLFELCLDYVAHEFNYKLCLFANATQRPKEDSEINLGSWGVWDGKEKNGYSHMKYENGSTCEDGPMRSTEVRLFCGPVNRLRKVSEPAKCKYSMDVISPAACTKPTKEQHSLAHDEL